ncbi:MAG: hypothetical protein GXY85_00420 [Candidatus Brocadiaceae bacterium]|nr:hypothetical protein [Candidatus Brocadiaceae bacterium]
MKSLGGVAVGLVSWVTVWTQVVGGSVLAAPATPDASELCARIAYAASQRIESGVFKCHLVKAFDPTPRPKGAIEREVEEFEAQLRADVRSGRVPASWQEELDGHRAGASWENFLQDPQVQHLVEAKIRRTVQSQRDSLVDLSKTTEEEAELRYVLGKDGRVRKETTYEFFKQGAEEIPQFRGRLDIVVLTPEQKRTFTPAHKVGTIHLGFDQNRRVRLWDMNCRTPLAGGCPASSLAKPENMVSVSEEETGEGNALRVVFKDSFSEPGVGNVHVLWVLPDKGYRLLREEVYIHGKLIMKEECSGYIEIEPGLWYPMRQRSELVKAQLPAGIEAAVKAGRLDRASEEVFAAQTILECRSTERVFSVVQCNAVIPEDSFALPFPEGTRVYDYVAGSEEKALIYVVGEREEAPTAALLEGLAEDTSTGVVATKGPDDHSSPLPAVPRRPPDASRGGTGRGSGWCAPAGLIAVVCVGLCIAVMVHGRRKRGRAQRGGAAGD